MSTVVCNKDCKYRKAMFCGQDFVMLNQFGQCVIWYYPNGSMRVTPDYREPEAATTQRV
jgi:hypothetical protein